MARNGSAASLAAARDRWEGQNIVPRSEYAVFRQLIVSVVGLNRALLAMIERFFYVLTSRDLGFDDDAVADTLARVVHRGFFAHA